MSAEAVEVKKRQPPMKGQVLAKVWNLDEYQARNPMDEVVDFCGDIDDANVTTSKVLGKETHKLVIDLDLPAKLLPSSTPGHFHLYINHEMSWAAYRNVLRALSDAGIIESGYFGASEQRGYSSVRLPWVRKVVDN